MEHNLYLSRRNLTAFLSKLDRNRAGDPSVATILKRDTANKDFPQTMPICVVTACENHSFAKHNNQVVLSRASITELLGGLIANGKAAIKLGPTDDVPPSMVNVTAIEDAAYYKDRDPGFIHPADDPGLKAAAEAPVKEEKEEAKDPDDTFMKAMISAFGGVPHDETGQRDGETEAAETEESSSSDGGASGGGGASEDIPEPELDPGPEPGPEPEPDPEPETSSDGPTSADDTTSDEN